MPTLKSTPHPRMCWHNMPYDWRPGWCSGVQLGAWNIGSLNGKRLDVCEVLRKRMVDVCCFHELRWSGQGSWMLGIEGWGSKLWSSGKGDSFGMWELW